MVRTVVLSVLVCARLAAQGTVPRAAASDYPVYGAVGKLMIAAEYLVHSIPAAGGLLYSPAYLVVEVAVYGPKLERAELSASYFSLRINGSKEPILAQQPFMVANAMEGPQQSAYPRGAVVGIGNAGVILGQPVDGPSQAPPVQDPLGRVPRTQTPPETPNPYLTQRGEQAPVREQVERAALPSGEVLLPVAGAMFFAYRGKTESIKMAELIYEGPEGMLELRLF